MEKAKKIRIDTKKNKKSDWLISWGLGEKKVGNNKTSTQNPSNQARGGGGGDQSSGASNKG